MSRRFGLTIDRASGTVVPSGSSLVQGSRSARVTAQSRRSEVTTRAPVAQLGTSRRAEIEVRTKPSEVFQAVATGVVAISDLIIEEKVATAPMLLAKQITLEAAPRDPTEVLLTITGGPDQKAGVDFIVTGNILSWNALALELLLEVGDSFTVQYLR